MTNALNRAIEAAKVLHLEIEKMVCSESGELSADDLQTIQDSFDGETTLEAELHAAVVAEDDDVILVSGIKARIAELKGRLERIEKRVEMRRGLIEQALTVAGWQKHEMDIATVSLRPKPPSVVIDAESEIPTQFFKRFDPALDKAGLSKVLKERHKAITEANKIRDRGARDAKLRQIDVDLPPISGVHLETDQTSLTIRRK